MAPDYDHLALMQKVEVFEHALENTRRRRPGQGLVAEESQLRGMYAMLLHLECSEVLLRSDIPAG